MNRCKFNQGQFNCGSYAFNLYKEGIAQGVYCDHHYWQDQAMKAVEAERKACAKVCDDKHDTWRWGDGPDSASGPRDCAAAIRARSNT